MKLYTFYTPTHETLYSSYFLPSTIGKGFEVISKYIPEQECKEGKYKTGGWTKTLQKKLELLIDASNENINKTFIFVDIDVILLNIYPDIVEKYIGKNILMAQNDRGELCAGMMILRGCPELTLFLQKSLQEVKLRNNDKFDDQDAINLVYKREYVNSGLMGFLPDKLFGCPGHFNGGRLWDGKTRPDIKSEYHTFHANWTEGVDNKIKLLNLALYGIQKPTCLVTSVYEDPLVARSDELIECFRINHDNPLINSFCIFYDNCLQKSTRTIDEIRRINKKPIRIVHINGKPEFNYIFEYVNTNLKNHRIILCNSDIFYDETLKYAINLNLANAALFLTRYNYVGRNNWVRYFSDVKYNGSFDTYIFDSPLPIRKTNLPTKLGEYACDSVMAAHFIYSGYKVYNPCLSIVSKHKHEATEWDSKKNSGTTPPNENMVYLPQIEMRDINRDRAIFYLANNQKVYIIREGDSNGCKISEIGNG